MSVSATSASAVVNAMALVRLGNGEYSAASVATDPVDAAKLALVRLQDNNYASPLFAGIVSSPAARATSGVQSALTSLSLGG